MTRCIGWVRGLCHKNTDHWCTLIGADSDFGALPETCGHSRKRD